jgi:DNA-binding NarL/FixJ family response regulator
MSALKNSIRVVLADDHHIFRLGLERLLEGYSDIELVAHASNGKHVLSLVQVHKPDVVVADVHLEEMGGEDLTRKISELYPPTTVLIVTMVHSNYSIMKLLRAGASGYVLKTSDGDEVIRGIRSAAKGEKYYCRTVTEQIRGLVAEGRFDPKTMEIRDFTPIELRVIELICREVDTKEMSNILHISVDSVKKYRKTILQKMDVTNVGGLRAYAIENGIYSE